MNTKVPPIHLGYHFRVMFKAAKLQRLFCHVSIKRETFELWENFRKCHHIYWLYFNKAGAIILVLQQDMNITTTSRQHGGGCVHNYSFNNIDM